MNIIKRDLMKLLIYSWILFSLIFSPLIILIHYSNPKAFWKDLKSVHKVIRCLN